MADHNPWAWIVKGEDLERFLEASPRRSIEESITLLPADSLATPDGDFASDVAETIAAYHDPLNRS
jgi:hypothetical protein